MRDGATGLGGDSEVGTREGSVVIVRAQIEALRKRHWREFRRLGRCGLAGGPFLAARGAPFPSAWLARGSWAWKSGAGERWLEAGRSWGFWLRMRRLPRTVRSDSRGVSRVSASTSGRRTGAGPR